MKSTKRPTSSSGEVPHPPPRLSPEEFHQAVRAKGWTFKALATYLQLTPVAVSNAARNANRGRYWDLALVALPNISRLRLRQRRAPRKRLGEGFRYHGLLYVGALVTAATAVGSIAEEGERGLVVEVMERKSDEIYGIIFPNGEFDRFSPDDFDRYMALSGLEDAQTVDYAFLDELGLRQHYQEGRFSFTPR